MSHQRICGWMLFLVAACAPAATGQEKKAQDKAVQDKAIQDKAIARATSAARIARFLDDETVALVRIDAAKFDVAGAVRELKRLLGNDLEDEISQGALVVEMAKGGFTAAGGRELYLVVTMADVSRGGMFGIIPLAEGTDPVVLAKSLRPLLGAATVTPGISPPPGRVPTAAEAFQQSMGLACEPLDRAVFIGPKATLERVKALPVVVKAVDFVKVVEKVMAVNAAGDSSLQAVLMMSADQRRVITEMLPQLPPALGGGATKPLLDGWRHTALAIDVSSKPSLRLVIQNASTDAAKAHANVVSTALGLLSQSAEVKRRVPAIDKIVKSLAPRVARDQVVIELNHQAWKETLTFVAPAVGGARAAAQRSQSANNLKQIGIALHNFYDVNRSFPARANLSAAGKPLLSWRVQLLPYLESDGLYKQFHLDEPWDSEHNKKLVAKMPKLFLAPGGKHKQEAGLTTYLAPVCAKGVFAGEKGARMADIRDGTSNTIAVVQVTDDAAVVWTKPDDWQVDDKDPLKGLGEEFAALFCDAAVRFFKKDIKPETLRALLTRDGDEVVSP